RLCTPTVRSTPTLSRVSPFLRQQPCLSINIRGPIDYRQWTTPKTPRCCCYLDRWMTVRQVSNVQSCLKNSMYCSPNVRCRYEITRAKFRFQVGAWKLRTLTDQHRA